jgi:hypothetical protein
MSTPRCMQARVPQGFVLFSTLYNLYINDTPQTIGVNLALFADDTCLYVYIYICTDKAEWTPFQTYYFSANLVAPGI